MVTRRPDYFLPPDPLLLNILTINSMRSRHFHTLAIVSNQVLPDDKSKQALLRYSGAFLGMTEGLPTRLLRAGAKTTRLARHTNPTSCNRSINAAGSVPLDSRGISTHYKYTSCLSKHHNTRHIQCVVYLGKQEARIVPKVPGRTPYHPFPDVASLG